MKKVLSLILTLLLIMMTTVIAPISVSASSLPITEAFDDLTFDSNWTVYQGDNITSEQGAAKISGAEVNFAGFQIGLGETVTSGTVKVKYDVYIPATNGNTAQLWLYGGENQADNRAITNMTDGTNMKFTNSLGNIFAPAKNTWYTIEATLDCGSLGVFIVATSREDGKIAATKYVTQKNEALKTTSNISIGTKNLSSGDYILFDNFSITKGEPLSWELPITDDFDGTSFDFAKWNGASSANVELSDGAAKLSGTNQSALGVKLDSAITTETISIKFDYYVPSENANAAKLWVYGGSAVDDSNSIANLSKTVLTLTGTGGQRIEGMTADKWYEIELRVDCPTQTITATVAPKEGGTSQKISAKSSMGALGSTSQIYFGTKDMASGDYILLDNVSIEKYVKPVSELPITDDFSDSEMDFVKWNGANSANVELSDGAAKLIGTNQGAMGVLLDNAITVGAISIKFDYYVPSENADAAKLWVYGGSTVNDQNSIANLSKTTLTLTGTGGKSADGMAAGKWYEVELIVDCSTLKLFATVTSKEDGATKEAGGTSSFAALGSTSQIYFGTKDMASGDYILIDNVDISRYYENPKMESITFVKHDDTPSTSLGNVPAGTKEIAVKFNTPMDDTTLSWSTMKLEKVVGTARTAVEYDGVYYNEALTWTIPLDDYLDASSTYELTMTSNVANGAGTKAAVTAYEFKTDAGEYLVDISVMKGGTEITALSQITKGDTLKIKADVINTTGEDQKLQLIYGGYNSNLLIDYQGYSKNIAKTDKKLEISDFTVTVDPTDMTHITLFDWYDFATLKCLSEPDTIQ